MRGSKKKAELPKPPPDPVLLVEHFKTQLTTHSSSAIHAQAIADEALAKVRALELELVEREKRTDDIASELTRTHKEYVSSMTARVNALEAEVERLNEELAAEKAQHQETIYQKDLEIAKKEADIVKMHERMEELINECGDMIADSIRRVCFFMNCGKDTFFN